MRSEEGDEPVGGHAIRGVDYESTPPTRGEYIAAIVHLYRGELYRATAWRVRLDATTNWAVLTTAGVLSLSYGEEGHSHLILLIGFALIAIFWAFESRRYRFADVWYSRVRKIEENFYGPILRRDPQSPEREWGALVAEDLFHPRFKIGRLQALRARLVRNYWAIFAVQFLAWTVKVVIHPTVAQTWAELQARIGLGILPWWLPVGYVGTIAAALLALFLFVPSLQEEHDHWAVSP